MVNQIGCISWQFWEFFLAVWFDPARSSANFVVLFPGIKGFSGFTSREAVLATFGKPARIYHVGRYTILYWRKNLLTELR